MLMIKMNIHSQIKSKLSNFVNNTLQNYQRKSKKILEGKFVLFARIKLCPIYSEGQYEDFFSSLCMSPMTKF